jgi:hypothetical protein
MSNSLEYFTCEVKHETDAAYLLNDGLQDIWIPKSQIEDEETSLKDGVEYLDFCIPEWLALQKGMI